MTLTPFVPISPDETLMSWATRLAAVHTGETLVPFLRDIGITPAEMLISSDSVIARLADVTGADATELRQQTIQTIERRKYSLRGERFEAEFMKGASASCCPACLLDDDEAGQSVLMRRGRVAWRLRPVRTCPIHGIALLDRPYIDWTDRFHQMGLVFPEAGPALRTLADAQVKRDVSPLQTYVTDRLSGKPGSAWLDGQGIELGARATELLGVTLEFGEKPDLTKFTTNDWDRAGRIGFEYTVRGEDGIFEALDHIKRRAFTMGNISSKSGPQKVFRHLYDWLNYRKNRKYCGPIRDIVRQFILETMFVPPGTKLFGEHVVETTIHTVGSLSAKSGVHRKTLRNALADAGLVPSGSWTAGEEFFDAAAGEEVVKKLFEAIPQAHLPAYMNATRGQVVQLIKGRFLQKSCGSGALRRVRSAVSRKRVDAFLDTILAQAREVDILPSDVSPINKASLQSRASTIKVVTLLQQRRLRHVFRLSGETGFCSIYLDPEEIKRHLVKDPETTPIGFYSAAKALGMSTVTLKSLVLLDLIKTTSTSAGKGKLSRIMPEAVLRFQESYVSLIQLSQELGVHHLTLRNALRNLGIEPIADPTVLKVTLFLRADIPLEFYDGKF